MPSINLTNIETDFWERQELNPGPLGEKQECHLCAMQLPTHFIPSVYQVNSGLPETMALIL